MFLNKCSETNTAKLHHSTKHDLGWHSFPLVQPVTRTVIHFPSLNIALSLYSSQSVSAPPISLLGWRQWLLNWDPRIDFVRKGLFDFVNRNCSSQVTNYKQSGQP